MTHLSLFSGIGGIDLAAEWAGFTIVAMVERDPFCQKVLAKNFPGVPIYDDVRTFDAKPFCGVTLVSGGFPCQDVSSASANEKAEGIDGDQSGLWWEAVRIVAECRPYWIVLENVYQLVSRGLDRVCILLEQEGFTVWPLVLGAGNTGAPHHRKRFFLVAHSNRDGKSVGPINAETQRLVGAARQHWNENQPRVSRVDDGFSRRLDADRNRALGNAVVPAQVFPILKAIAAQINGEVSC